MKKELIDFAMEMAETIYSLQYESDFFYEIFDSNDNLIPEEFSNKILENEKHKNIIQTEMFSDMLCAFVKDANFLEKCRNEEGNLEYHPELLDYDYLMSTYVREQYENSTDKEILDSLPEKTFNIDVCRTGIAFRTAEVKARTLKEAQELALDEAGDHEYSEKEADYKIV